jgi:hypothetical protein
MSISTYFRPNIHQNSLEILGVKVQDLTIENKTKIVSFLSLSYMPISTYLRPNICQNGPEIEGVRLRDYS